MGNTSSPPKEFQPRAKWSRRTYAIIFGIANLGMVFAIAHYNAMPFTFWRVAFIVLCTAVVSFCFRIIGEPKGPLKKFAWDWLSRTAIYAGFLLAWHWRNPLSWTLFETVFLSTLLAIVGLFTDLRKANNYVPPLSTSRYSDELSKWYGVAPPPIVKSEFEL